MSEMIERVAKAIEQASQPPGQPDYAKLMENCARAAIEAMRDLPDEVFNSLPKDYEPGSHSADQIWKILIGEVLK